MVRMIPFVSVIVAAYNAEKTIERCLEHLLKLNYPNYEIIVVDNDSGDETKNIVKNYSSVIYLFEKKRGWPAARNRGIKYSKAGFVANIDSDCFAQKDWLKILVRELISEPGIGGVVGKTLVEKGESLLEQYYAEGEPFNIERHIGGNSYVPWGGGNNAYRKEVFEIIGYYDSEHYTSGADVEFHHRLKNNSKYRIKYVPEAVIYHSARNSIKGLFKASAKYSYDGLIQAREFSELKIRYSLYLLKKINEILKNIVGLFYRFIKFIFGKETKLRAVSPLFSIVSYSGNLYGFLKAKIKLQLEIQKNTIRKA